MLQIRDIPIFECLDDEDAAAIGRACTWRDYKPGALMVDFEDSSTDVRFILTGRIRVLIRVASGKEAILGEFGSGNYFGEMAAIDGNGRSANVTALQRSSVCIMPADVFLDTVTGSPQISRQVMKDLVSRVRHLNVLLTEQHFLSAAQRLYAELLRLSRPRKGRAADMSGNAGRVVQRIITPPPTQHDIAARIGCSREGVSRELSVLEKDGLVEKTKGGLVLKDVDELSSRLSAALGDQN